MTTKTDFRVSDEGTIVRLEPLTRAAKRFVRENIDVPDWAYFGNTICCDHRPGHDIVDRLLGDGYNIDFA